MFCVSVFSVFSRIVCVYVCMVLCFSVSACSCFYGHVAWNKMDDDDDDHEKEFVSDLWASFQTSPISAFLVDECVSFTLADKLNEACRCNYNTATTAMGTMQWNFGMKTVKFRCVFLWDMVTYRQTDRQTDMLITEFTILHFPNWTNYRKRATDADNLHISSIDLM